MNAQTGDGVHPLIRLQDIGKVYRTGAVEVHALRRVSLEIGRGDFVAFTGSSGSGKSTLMNILGCLDQPTAGHYFFDGNDVSRLRRNQLADVRNQKIGFVFQSFNLLSRTCAIENVELPLLYSPKRIGARAARMKAEGALAIVGLADRAGHHPNQLSGGQQQRVAIARALVNEPEILLADEPTGNLDSDTTLEIMDVLRRLNQSGITLVLVTHEPLVAAYAKRKITMRDGNIAHISSQSPPVHPAESGSN